MAFLGSLSGSLSSYRSNGGWAVCPPVRCISSAARDRFIAPRSAQSGTTAAMKEALFPVDPLLTLDYMDPRHYQVAPKKKQASNYEEALCVALFDLTISQAAKKKVVPIAKESPLPVVPVFRHLHKPLPTRRAVNLHSCMTLDVPGMTDDFYRSPMAWSSQNLIAVQLDQVYIKNMGSAASPTAHMPMDPNQPVSTSVHWLKNGSQLVAANPNGSLELYDAAQTKIGTYSGPQLEGYTRPECNTFENWDAHTVLVGNRSGALLALDTRMQTACSQQLSRATLTRIACSNSHTIAIGANDNNVTLVDLRKVERMVVYEHKAAVKAVAWSPWDPSILITGAGTNDRSIRLFDVKRNLLLDQVETDSQVCTLFASSHYRELVSTHGYSGNEIRLWRHRHTRNRDGHYLEACETIPHAHSNRVLHAQMSPDSTTLATSSADEMLRFWPLFTSGPLKPLQPAKPPTKALTIAHSTIR